ncbi:MAG: hypothetical protein ABI718_06550, partial [Acidobacteriota bacterium]
MEVSIHRSLWAAFAALMVLIVTGVALNLFVLNLEKQQNYRVHQIYEPLMEKMLSMDRDLAVMLGAARGYTLSRRTEFLASYDDAVRDFEKKSAAAIDLAEERRDEAMVAGLREHFRKLRQISDDQIRLSDAG